MIHCEARLQERGILMQQKVKIVTDSSATMEQQWIEKYDIHVIPLTVMIDNVVYIDGVTVKRDQFMDMMAESSSLPKTSQPPIGEFIELYNELGRDGSSIISIHLAQSLSGTVDGARQAANIAEADVTVIDSHFTDQSQAFLVLEAAKMAQEGATKEEIITRVEQIRDQKSKLFMGVANLNNLVEGGRISRVTGVLSSFLNIRIMLEMEDSHLNVISKGRGEKFFKRWFDKFKLELQQQEIVQIGISHAGVPELAEYFKTELNKIYPDMHIPTLQTTPIVATHSGKGAFAIMYTTK